MRLAGELFPFAAQAHPSGGDMNKQLRLAVAVSGMLFAGSVFAADIDGLARTCNNCHGVNGVSAGGAMPSIGGLSEAYLKQIMMQWKSGDRASATMTRLIKGYSDDQIAALAKYYSSKPWTPNVQPASAEVMKKGKDATDRCETCHGDTGGKPDDDLTPRLNGQSAKYMLLELMKYRDEGFKMAHQKMIKNARKMDEADLGNVVHFYANQSK
jgi:sulfide dehydrogenase cytochrome subunit